ncbi:MAG TPA: restriction endonuclease subunit S [Nostoc sp.]|uniref:restriction endonuclease subunit S n=1 Tax=Nostoc sp. TaxID=1180 RepID=UPI002D6206AA|nr:restriction endonuclease subunit S [Nostoc sp.]HYX15404.1 restriction endonuclease subunit S [Nostoc sp.]
MYLITGGSAVLLQTRNIDEFFVNTEDCQRITQKFHQQLKKSQIKKGDVLIARSGSFGKASIYLDSEVVNSADIIIVESNKNRVNPFYLVGFINSKFGTSQLFRFASGGLQGHVNLTILENLLIPTLKSDFQDFLELLIKYSYNILKDSKKFYQQAEDLLLSELGLKNWQTTEETFAVKSFAESFLSSGRFDAEYYQPKQQKVMAIIRQSGLCISNVVSLAKRKFQPEEQGTFNYIEIGNLRGEGFANSEVVAMEEAPSRAQWIVKTNDVITSTVRPIRRLSALIETEQSNYICSSGFAVLKPTKIEPEVLLVYLRSPIVCEILDLHTTASMYPAISTEDLLNIPITLPQESTRQKITEKVRASRKAREQSKQLLEIAKTGVERAIETDEATATIWINQQLEALGVKLT